MEMTPQAVACPKCGSHHVMRDVVAEAKETGSFASHPLTMRLSRPGFLGFSSTARGEVKATVCADCGYTELYTDNLAELWQMYSQDNR